MKIEVSMSIGEAVDRWSILDVKRSMIIKGERAKRVKAQFEELTDRLVDQISKIPVERLGRLTHIHVELWEIEDQVRIAIKSFEAVRAIKLFSRVSELNDERAKIKQGIDKLFGGDDAEVKQYATD